MKLLLLLSLFLPTIALGQQLPGYDVQMVREHAYVTPRLVKFTLQRNETPGSDACGFGKEVLKNVSQDYQRFNCKNKPEDNLCKNIRDMVINFAKEDQLAQYGSRVASFSLKTKLIDQARVTRDLGEELQISVDRVHLLIPDLTKSKLDIVATQENNFFLKLLAMVDLPHGLYQNGAMIVSEDRLSTCALLDKALSVHGQIDTQLTVETERPMIEVYSLYSFYHGVSNNWARIEGKNWKNPLHQILYISNILQENMKKYHVEKLYSMEQLYDSLFTSYIQQDEFSIYLNKFKDMTEFARKVHPPFQDDLNINVQLIQN